MHLNVLRIMKKFEKKTKVYIHNKSNILITFVKNKLNFIKGNMILRVIRKLFKILK